MRFRWLLAGAMAASLTTWGLSIGAQEPAAAGPESSGDDAAGTEAAENAPVAADVADADPLLTEDELDDLVAPVALYPDSLLTQVLVAATYPLDVVKADHFLTQNTDLSDKARADATEGEDWDPSVQVLAAGFPTVVKRMAADIDWTEDLGDAMLAQTDDLLDAVQRMRARAAATGNLTSNEAQTVATEGDSIAIAPADPQVVYVPTYDPVTTYTTPAPAVVPATVPATTTTVVEDDDFDVGGVIATGAIAFGTALLVDEIFDDDDDDWDNYWYGPRHIDWDDDAIYPGRGINVEGDVNIDRNVERNRNRIDVDRNNVKHNDRNRTKIGVDDGDRRHDKGAWKADADKRQQARDKIAEREDTGKAKGRPDKLKAGNAHNDDARAKLQAANEKRAPSKRIDTDTRPRPEAGGKPANRPEANRPEAKRPEAKRPDAKRPDAKPTAFKPGNDGPARTKAATDRGAQSLKSDKSKVATKARSPQVSKPKAISKPAAKPQMKSPPRKPQAKPTAFSKPSSGNRAKAASHRGGAAKMKRR